MPRRSVLRLGGNGIEDAGARAIASALMGGAVAGGGNVTLRSLVLDDNHITADGARALADALARGAPLTALALRSNALGADGARHLALALRTNTSLEVRSAVPALLGRATDARRSRSHAGKRTSARLSSPAESTSLPLPRRIATRQHRPTAPRLPNRNCTSSATTWAAPARPTSPPRSAPRRPRHFLAVEAYGRGS